MVPLKWLHSWHVNSTSIKSFLKKKKGIEQNLALKWEGILAQAVTWLNLEDLVPSAVRQVTVCFHLCEEPHVVAFIETKSRMPGSRVWGRREWVKIQFGKMKIFWRWIV